MTIPSPFSASAAAPAQSRLRRLLRRPDVGGAAAAVERLIAVEWPTPSRGAVLAALREFHVGGEDARAVCRGLFARAMAAVGADHAMSVEEADQLQLLKSALALTPRDVQEAHRKVAELLYDTALSRALDEENLTPDERSRLDALTSHLRVSPDRRGVLHRQQAQHILDRVLGRQSPQRQLTREETAAVRAMADTFGTRIDLGEVTQAHLDRFALLWQIERGELPGIAVRIRLLRSEVCHFYSAARWLEVPSARPHPPEPPARVVRGASYRLANHPERTLAETGAVQADRGTLYITNKRCIFDGRTKQVAIRHSDVRALGVYADGFVLEKSWGKWPSLSIDGDAPLASVILAEALARDWT